MVSSCVMFGKYGMAGCGMASMVHQVRYDISIAGCSMVWTGRTHRKRHLRLLLVLNSLQDYSIAAAFAEEVCYQDR